ncbi:hypothetical protein F4777DRAFT_569967 [Nemania sp. FL0916]|nr:hypothetical protein F4777DRAFT_569967 [Nemania sp. FL0916]
MEMSSINSFQQGTVKTGETGEKADHEAKLTFQRCDETGSVMGSQMGPIMALPSEIMLRIVENMSTATRNSFMATNKEIHRLIVSYQCSISKARVSTFTLPPLGNILSSSNHIRLILPKNSFSMLSELEFRDARIDFMLREFPEIFRIASPPWLPSLTLQQQIRLTTMLKRAFYQCDRIADIAADRPSRAIPLAYNGPTLDGFVMYSPYPSPRYSPIPGGDLHRQYACLRPSARSTQIEYIKSLSLEDVAGIFMLVDMLGEGLMCPCMANSPLRPERKTILEECVLRHGSWFVWSRLGRDSNLREVSAQIISIGSTEMNLWESGDATILIGLKMTLMTRLRKFVGGRSGGELAANISKALAKLVIGEDKQSKE